jgi:hypothetical protein
MSMADQWYLSREGKQYGPYTWEKVIEYSHTGKIDRTDLLWSQSTGSWLRADQVPGLMPIESSNSRKPPVKKRPAFLAIGGLLAVTLLVVVLFSFFLNRQDLPDIIDYYPQSGQRGSHVYLLFEEDISGFEGDLKAFYNNEEIFIVDIFDDFAEVALPGTAGSGNIEFRAGDLTSNAVEFKVEEAVLTHLYSETLQPSSEPQVVNYLDEIVITIPPGVLDQPRTLSISAIENAPANSFNPLDNTAIDITIEGLEQLSDYLEIAIKYEPEAFDSGYAHEEQLMALRWDEQHKYWIPVPFRVDEENRTIYMETDHLCYFKTFISIPSKMAVATTIAKTGAAIGATVATGWVVERISFTSYSTEHFTFLYNKKLMDIIYSSWEKPAVIDRPGSYKPGHPEYIQDIGALFEMAFNNYIDRGFKNPVVKPGYIYGERRTPIMVKISGLWSMGSGYLAGQEEMQYGKIFGAIHLPVRAFKKDSGELYAGIGHELFHAMQSEYYRFHRYLNWVNTGDYWWIEATAEYAGSREAWGKNNKTYDPALERGIGKDFFSYPLNTKGLQQGWTKDYEYAAAMFIRFLVDERNLDFKDLFEYVSEGEPFTGLDQYIRNNTPPDRWADLGFTYTMFARWGFFSGDSFLSSRDTASVADRVDILYPEEGEPLQIEITNNEAVWFEVFKTDHDSRSSVSDYNIPFNVLGTSVDEVTVENPGRGGVIYILAVNNTPQDQSVEVVVRTGQVSEEARKDNSGELKHTFNLKGNHTAKLWAVKIGEVTLKITPDEIEEGETNTDYSFEVEAADLPPDLSSVFLSWDFGVSESTETETPGTGTSEVPVTDGRAALTIEHSYTEPGDYTLAVTLTDPQGDLLAEARAVIIIEGVEVKILGGSKDYLLEAGPDYYYEYTHNFEAVVAPPGTGSYLFEWDFGDGTSPVTEEGEASKVSYKYTGIKPGDIFRPKVTLYSLADRKPLSADEIALSFNSGEQQPADGKDIYFYGPQTIVLESYAFPYEQVYAEHVLIVHYRLLDPNGTLEWDMGDGSGIYSHPASHGHTEVRSDIVLEKGYVQVAMPYTYTGEGQYRPVVKMLDGGGNLLGQAAMTITVRRVTPDTSDAPNYDWIPKGD